MVAPPSGVILPGIASEIVMRDPRTLKPFQRNARFHSEKQVDQIMASIRRFGFTVPLLIDVEGGCEIIAGHGRQLAALRLGLEEVPTMDAGWLSEPERRAYRLADNRIALSADWDETLLTEELARLLEDDFDLTEAGFTEGDLKNLGIGGLGDGGDAPEQHATEMWSVIVECADEADQIEMINRLLAEGRKVKAANG
jgi:ParB-like chromosome segregation protein Spo0J